MSNYENTLILLENLSSRESVSIDDLTNVFCRIIEDSQSADRQEDVRDAVKFADQLAFLCGQLAEVISGHREVLDAIPAVLQKQFEQDQQTIEEQRKSLTGYEEQFKEALKNREEILAK